MYGKSEKMRRVYDTLKGVPVRYRSILCVFILLVHCEIILADDNQLTSHSSGLPPVETFLLEPVELENVCVWVPADKAGPFINMACQPRSGSYSFVLGAKVEHTKTQTCPETAARLLAEYTARYHQEALPLTIFNGWQWEYSYSLCEFETVGYELDRHGGSWENSWEAILTQSVGSANCQWLQIRPFGEFVTKSGSDEQKSSIDVRSFSSMRTRDGYPKKRKL